MDEKLPRRINYWLTEAEPDCIFVVGPENGETQRIGALKTLLIGDSEPFRAMLKDSALAEKADIRITDIEPETFRIFLKCVYGGSSVLVPKLTFEESAELLYVTEKYLINDISGEVYKHMKEIFSDEDIFVALSNPICHEKHTLKGKILEILKYDFEKLTHDDKFLNLSSNAIAWMVQQESFTVREIEIWNAILKWARHNTDSSDGTILRGQISHVLKDIRFLAMKYSEFWKIVVPSGILYKEEIYSICKSMGTGKQCCIENMNNCRYNRYDRQEVSRSIITTFIETPEYILIRCSISSVSGLVSETYNSESCRWAEYLWDLEISVEEGFVDKKDYLAVYLRGNRLTSTGSCETDIEITLMNTTGKLNVTKSCSTTFSKENDYKGWGSFYSWEALMAPSNGFVKEDSIMLISKIKLKNV